MATQNQKTGKAYIKIDGQLYESMSGAKLSNFSGVERDPVVGTDTFGYAEKAVTPTIDCEFAHGSSLSMATLAAITNSTVTFECDSGPTFILRNAWWAKGGDLATGDGGGKVTAQFMGLKCDEMLS